MPEPTEGPWHIKAGYDWVIESQDGTSVAGVYTPRGVREVRQANARRIAAAPEMEKALEGLEFGGCFCPAGFGGRVGAQHIDRCTQARAALAKARGETS